MCLTASPVTSLAISPAHAAEPALTAPGAPFRVPATNPPAQAPTPWGTQLNEPAERNTVTCSQGPTGTVSTWSSTRATAP